MVFRSNPVDLLGWQDEDVDLTFAQDASFSGRVVQQRKPRIMAQRAALEEVANCRFRRLQAFKKSSTCADVKIGDAVLFYEA